MTKIVTKDKFEEIVQALHEDCIVAFPTDTVFAFKLLLDKSRALPIELEPHINYMYRVCSWLTSFNHERFNHTHPYWSHELKYWD